MKICDGAMMDVKINYAKLLEKHIDVLFTAVLAVVAADYAVGFGLSFGTAFGIEPSAECYRTPSATACGDGEAFS